MPSHKDALLAGGADPNARDGARAGEGGDMPLHYAASNGHAEAIRALLADGADAEAPDVDGLPPLALAKLSGNAEAIRVLREAP